MCWINWIITKFKSENEINNILERMNFSIKHRWPDDQGIYLTQKNENIIWLAQVRLSILDLSNAWSQPMWYNADFWAFSWKYHKEIFIENQKSPHYPTITFNWEIYNYQEIKSELIKKWYKFNTNCDTEVILASYQEWGENCVNRFNWMWAFAIFDPIKNILFCSVDRFGKKPFYYYWNWDNFIFSSQIKSILNYWVKKDISQEWLWYYLTFWYIPAPNSIFENISKLKHSNNLILNLERNKLDIKQYYKIEINDEKEINELNIKNNIIEKLEKAIEYRIISDVPVWTFLSGGIDSSLITTITKKKFWIKKLHTFSIWFEQKFYDESLYSQETADYIWSIHHNHILKEKETFEILNSLPQYYDEPFADSSMIATYSVSKLAKEYVTVALSWDWADEVFWWYLNFIMFYYLNILNKILPYWIRDLSQIFAKIVNNIIKPSYTNKWFALWLKAMKFLDHKKDFEIFAKLMSLHIFENQYTIKYLEEYFNKKYRKDNLIQSYLNTNLIYDYLIKVDRASMANSLEIRCPFLDKDLVEYWMKIPSDYKIKSTWKFKFNLKYILKEAWKEYLPEMIYKRKKHWFAVPIAEYFKDNRSNFVKEKIDKLIIRDVLPLNKQTILEIIHQHNSGIYDNFWFIYSLVFLELWFEHWIDL